MKRSMKKFMVTCAAVTAIAAAGVSAMAADYTAENNSVKFDVPAADADTQMTVLVIPKDKDGAVTDADIYYIDQDGTLSGEALLKGDKLEDGTYLVKVGYYSEGKFAIKDDEFKVGKDIIVPPVVETVLVGDADASEAVDELDALTILEYCASIPNTIDMVAADADQSESVDEMDALSVLEYCAGIPGGIVGTTINK